MNSPVSWKAKARWCACCRVRASSPANTKGLTLNDYSVPPSSPLHWPAAPHLHRARGVGPYVGGSVGSSNYSSDSCVGNCDKTDIGFKVVGGYMFTPYLGAEVGYGAFGKA